MHIVKSIVRLALSAIIGWYLLTLIAIFTEYLGYNAWGLIHTGLPLLLLPFIIYISYKLLGVSRLFKSYSNDQK